MYTLIQLNISNKISRNKRLSELPIYVINLNYRIDNKYELTRQFKLININDNVTFFRAYDHTYDIVKKKYNEHKSKHINNKINREQEQEQEQEQCGIIKNIGAMGLIVSTIELFKKIEESGIDHVIILEDDIQLHKSWNYMMKPIKSIIEHTDLLYIGFNNHNKDVNQYFRNYYFLGLLNEIYYFLYLKFPNGF